MKVQNVSETIDVYEFFSFFGTYFVETCQIGVFKMHSILHPAKEPYLVWLMLECKCCNKLEHCLYIFLSSNSPAVNTVRNFLFSDHGSRELYAQFSEQDIMSVIYNICSFDTITI